MRRFCIVAALCAAVMLPAGAAAAAPGHRTGDGHHEARSATARAVATAALAGKARFAPLGARLAGAASVYGTLRDSYGSPTAGAHMKWYSWNGASWLAGDGTTTGDGSFSLSVAAPTSNGEIWGYPNDDSILARGSRPWTDGGSFDESLYPGRVGIFANRGGRWGDFDKLVVRMAGPGCYSKGAISTGTDTTSPVSGYIDVLDGTYTAGSAEFFWDEGLEFYAPMGVTSGATAVTTIAVNEAAAQRVWMRSPYWYSGKAGVAVRMALNCFPVGWINRVTGYTDDPDGTASRTLGTLTSTTVATQSLRVKVPSDATPGYGYWIGFQHVDASGNDQPLYLEETYQVCTMKPSRSAVRKGAKIRVTGVVPTAGHWGTQAGLEKVVTLYSHQGLAAAPTRWEPKRQGWVKVGSVRTNGYGAYRTPYFRPLKTITLVARYPGDDWYFDAYTSVATVKVR